MCLIDRQAGEENGRYFLGPCSSPIWSGRAIDLEGTKTVEADDLRSDAGDIGPSTIPSIRLSSNVANP